MVSISGPHLQQILKPHNEKLAQQKHSSTQITLGTQHARMLESKSLDNIRIKQGLHLYALTGIQRKKLSTYQGDQELREA